MSSAGHSLLHQLVCPALDGHVVEAQQGVEGHAVVLPQLLRTREERAAGWGLQHSNTGAVHYKRSGKLTSCSKAPLGKGNLVVWMSAHQTGASSSGGGGASRLVAAQLWLAAASAPQQSAPAASAQLRLQ